MNNNQNGINNPNYKHGQARSRLYRTYLNIKNRCFNESYSEYKNYGGRGITICPEWTDELNGFTNFRGWSLINGYTNNLEIDRVNNDKNYSPENCRWVTRLKNAQNARKALTMVVANEIRELYKTGKYTQKELAKKYNIKQATISYIISNKRWVFDNNK